MEVIVPVYLNHAIVFDLVAMLQGGLATVTRVAATEGGETGANSATTGRLGLGSALAGLFTVGLSVRAGSEQSDRREHSTVEERVHTPSSLFFTLRNELDARQMLKRPEGGVLPAPGDMVEFRAFLRPNPVVQTMLMMSAVLDMAALFEDKAPKAKHGKQAPSESTRIRKQTTDMLEQLKAGGTIDILTDGASSEYRAVVTIEEEYLADPSMADLVDGQFSVLGKVIRSVADDSEAINLLRKTPFSVMTDESVEEVMGHLAQLSSTGTFVLPQLEWRIKGPVIHVLPVAIFA